MTAVVSLRKVAKSYVRGRQQVEILHSVDLQVARELHLDKSQLVTEPQRRAA